MLDGFLMESAIASTEKKEAMAEELPPYLDNIEFKKFLFDSNA